MLQNGGAIQERRSLRILIPAVAMFILGCCWALASPPGSSADEDFHLTTIWCSWGDSETCINTSVPGLVLVPETVAKSSCFAFVAAENASCVYSLSNRLVETDRVNVGRGSYPGVFHAAMRAFVGPDVNKSVLLMRAFNVLLASLLLAAALALCRPAPRRAVALAWAVCLIPTSVYFVASANPSSWVITGIAFFWAFLHTALHPRALSTTRGRVALGLAVLCAALALGARSDAAIYLTVSVACAVLLRWSSITTKVKWALAVVVIAVVAIAVPFSLGGYLSLSLSFPATNPAMDQPNPLLKTLLELPSFVYGIVGGQPPVWSQRNDANNYNMEGYTSTGFSFGVGWTDVSNPSLAGVLVGLSVAFVLALGLRSMNWRKAASLALLAGALVGQIIWTRAMVGFQVVSLMQPRYVIPLAILFVGVAALAYPTREPLVPRAHAVIIAVSLTLAGSVSFLATMSRYTISQTMAYSNLGTEPGWWWPRAPAPTLVWAVASIAGVALFISLLLYGTDSGRSEQLPRKRSLLS